MRKPVLTLPSGGKAEVALTAKPLEIVTRRDVWAAETGMLTNTCWSSSFASTRNGSGLPFSSAFCTVARKLIDGWNSMMHSPVPAVRPASSKIPSAVFVKCNCNLFSPTRKLSMPSDFQSAGKCGAKVSVAAFASVESPNMPRSSGLTTMAADQIWCGELVDAGADGEQRPNGCVVVSAAAKFWRTIGNDAHAPVGLVIDAGKLRDHSTRIFLFGQAKPHGNGREHAGFVNRLAIGSQCEGVALFAGKPECVIYFARLFLGVLCKLRADGILASQMRQIGQRAQRRGAQAAFRELGFYRQQRAALHPAAADSEILAETLLTIPTPNQFLALPAP